MDTEIIYSRLWAESINLSDVNAIMQVDGEGAFDEDTVELIEQARAIGRPKAILRPCAVTAGSAGEVVINGVSVISDLVYEKLHTLDSVVAYVCTCGRELDEWARQYAADPINEFITSSIMKHALGYAVRGLHAYI